MSRRNTGMFIAVAVGLFMSVVGLGIMVSGEVKPKPFSSVDYTGLPDCQTEDDTADCYWDANRRGNQEGSSFIHYRGNYYLLDD